MKQNEPLGTARTADTEILRAGVSVPFSSSPNLIACAIGQPHQFARLRASIAEQEAQAIEAPRRRAILKALQAAFRGRELSLLDFDTTLPENIVAYRQALDDVRSEVACGGRVIRAAAAILALERLRGKAPR